MLFVGTDRDLGEDDGRMRGRGKLSNRSGWTWLETTSYFQMPIGDCVWKGRAFLARDVETRNLLNLCYDARIRVPFHQQTRRLDPL
jgi:hypothetical protein